MNQKVTLEGRGVVTISDKDYVTAGGEGTVYRLADTAIKLYLDKSKVDRDKVSRLSKIKHPSIAAPVGLALDAKSTPLGFYGPWANGTAMPMLFTNDFRIRKSLTDADSSTLAEKMRETVQFAHDQNCVLVDGNELNWLADIRDRHSLKPVIIDVDSWVTDGVIPPVVAKMPSINDPHSKTVSISGDWYAWGVVTFLLYVGIHPFKGNLSGYKPSEMTRRMRDNASVFSKGIKLNAAVREFSAIPNRLRQWYEKTFSTAERSIPPSPFDLSKAAPAALIARTVVTATGKLKHEKVFDRLTDPVIRVFPCGAALTKGKKIYDLPTKELIHKKVESPDCQLIRVEDGWIMGDNGRFSFLKLGEEPELLSLYANGTAFTADDRLFLANDAGLNEVKLRQIGRNIVTIGGPSQTWGCMFNSTHWFDGVGIMDALSAMFLIIPFGGNAVAQIRARELDGLKPLAAKSANRFASIIALDDAGIYRKIEFYFDAQYASYKVWEGVSEGPELNLTILPKGVAATIIEDGQLIIFVPSIGTVNKLSDKDISTSMILGRHDNSVLYIRNGQVWKVSS